MGGERYRYIKNLLLISGLIEPVSPRTTIALKNILIILFIKNILNILKNIKKYILNVIKYKIDKIY